MLLLLSQLWCRSQKSPASVRARGAAAARHENSWHLCMEECMQVTHFMCVYVRAYVRAYVHTYICMCT